MKFENSVVIDQPIKKVFEFVTHFENNTIWQTDILEIQMTSEGPVGPGSTYRCVNRFMGQRFETETCITGYVSETLCSVKIASGDVTGESNFLFEPVNGSTRFTTVAELDLGFFKFAQMIVKHKIKRQLKNDMSTLKKILENGEHVKMS